MIGDDNRLLAAFCIGFLNWCLLCAFIVSFKNKIDRAAARYTINKYEDEEVMVAGQSLLIENIPRDIKVHHAQHHTKALFNELLLQKSDSKDQDEI